MRPEINSPLRGRIHFRRLFSSKPILLAVRRRTIHVTPASATRSAALDPTMSVPVEVSLYKYLYGYGFPILLGRPKVPILLLLYGLRITFYVVQFSGAGSTPHFQ
jgi:hypothetical protein